MKEQMIEEVTIDGRPIRLEHADVPIDQIELDENNPRIRYRLKLQQNGKSLEQVIMLMPEVKALKRDIEKNGGLRERVILQPNGTKLKAMEGNVRVTCYQDPSHKCLDDPRWKTVPARILPKDVHPKQIAILLADFHVAGKITWKAHEKDAKIGEYKWSYFEEFFKQRDLREEFKKNPEFGDDFCRWVGEGHLPAGEDVRVLPSILRHPEARKKIG